jgi:hypothetical protein
MEAMDESSRLVSELQDKLLELDHKVWQYRIDMVSEFTKYSEEVLRDVPTAVSESVSKVMAESIKNYKSLDLSVDAPIESCTTGNNGSLAYHPADESTPYIQHSMATVPEHMQSVDGEADVPRSPHEREKEFQGLFTPRYLPLLESTNKNERKSTYNPPPQPPLMALTKGKEVDISPLQVDASTTTSSFSTSPDVRRPPTPKRKNTDEMSVASNYSDSGSLRRSALRRTSSGSKGASPRRVRFDVAGEEVLPTTEPLPNEAVLATDMDSSYLDYLDNDLDGEAELDLDEDNEEPLQRRISSSQALRALSRGPFEDDGTQWTTVSAPPDGSASVAINSEDLFSDDEANLSSNDTTQAAASFNLSPSTQEIPRKKSAKFTTGDDDEETQSDDEMNESSSLKSMRNQRPAALILPPDRTHINENELPIIAKRSPNKPRLSIESILTENGASEVTDLNFMEEEEDQLFAFDDGDEKIQQRSPPDEQDESEPDSPITLLSEKVALRRSDLSRSPGLEIPKPPAEEAPKPAINVSRGVVGSYKGRPFSMQSVSDEIHAQAASLGEITTFVGSVNGRSGLDESDIQSFRPSASMGKFSGTPRSLSERMMLEDLLEAEAAKRNEQK